MIDYLQSLYKLNIPTTNHGIAISSFKNKYPKFFNKQRDYKVIKEDTSFFHNISISKDWNNPQSVFKIKLMEKLIIAEKSIANAIEEDTTLST